MDDEQELLVERAVTERSTPAALGGGLLVDGAPLVGRGSVLGGYARQFEQLEQQYDARLGVHVVDTGTNRRVTYRATERFPFSSTYKALAAAAVLERRSLEALSDVVTYTPADLVASSPITQQHVDTGMTVRDLCDAAIRHDDATAGNLLYRELGGPQGLQTDLRRLGDRTTRTDRLETDLNQALPSDPRDTSTPQALGADLRAFVLGRALPAAKKAVLTDWLVRNTTGAGLIRGGVPVGWTVGDKPGAGRYGTRNDIAVVWPPTGEPLVLAILSTRSAENATYDNALIAAATTIAVDLLR